ncbi:hypothetical protein L9F63_016183, partial [Diploptera punctata]
FIRLTFTVMTKVSKTCIILIFYRKNSLRFNLILMMQFMHANGLYLHKYGNCASLPLIIV